MEIKVSKKTIKHIAIGAIACIVIYWLITKTDHVRSTVDWIMGILSPFIIGSVLAFIINVPMRAIEKHLMWIKKASIRRAASLALALILFLLILAVLALLLYFAIADIGHTISNMDDFFGEDGALHDFLNRNPELLELVIKHTNFEENALGDFSYESFDYWDFIDLAFTYLGRYLNPILQHISTAVSGVMNAFIAIVFAIYALFQKETLARQGRKVVYALFSEKTGDYIVNTMRLSNATFSNFLSGQCIEVCILGTMFAIAMSVLGMPHVALISILIAVTAFIPIVGAWAGCIVGAFLILVSTFDTNPLQAVFFVVLFMVLQMIENNLIYPKVVGTSIGLPGMWVLIAVAFGGELMGIAGMFLMIPIVSVVYTLIQQGTAKRLQNRTISPEKLTPQPPELRSSFRERMKAGKKIRAKKAETESTEVPSAEDNK